MIATPAISTPGLNDTAGSTDPSQQQDLLMELSRLQVKVQSLEKYKTNYEMLCGQLSALNTQVGEKLASHEQEVSELSSRLSSATDINKSLEAEVSTLKAKLSAQAIVATQDREYADSIHEQLCSAAASITTRESECVAKEQATTTLVNDLQSANETLATEVAHYKVKRETYHKAKKQLKKVRAELSREFSAREVLEKVVRRQKRQNQELSSDFMSLKADAENTMRSLVKESERVKSLEDIAEEKSATIQALTTDLKALGIKAKSLESQNKKLMKSASHDLKKSHSSLKAASSKTSEYKQEILRLKGKLDLKQERIEYLEVGMKKLERISAVVVSARNNSDEMTRVSKSPDDDNSCSDHDKVVKLEEELAESKNQLEVMTSKIVTQENESNNARQEVSILNSEIIILTSEIHKLKDEFISFTKPRTARRTTTTADDDAPPPSKNVLLPMDLDEARVKLKKDREALKAALSHQITSSKRNGVAKSLPKEDLFLSSPKDEGNDGRISTADLTGK